MEFVKLTLKDKKQIIELDTLSFVKYDLPAITEEEVKKLMKNGFALGVKKNNRLVSNIQVFYKNSVEWRIWTIATIPEKRKTGLADRLLKEVVKLAMEKNAKITAMIKPDNTQSIRLFQRNGFLEVEYVKDYHGPGRDRIIFEFRS